MIFDDSGNNLIQLTSDNSQNRYPRYSPDGEKIIYCFFYEHPYSEIMMMNADGTGVVTVIDRACAYRSFWSPKCDKILYARKHLKLFYSSVDAQRAKPDSEIVNSFCASLFLQCEEGR